MNALTALTEFATQRSGIQFANYGEIKSFRSEQRSITKDLRLFRSALLEALREGVTEKEVVEVAPHAFSGRLTWNGERWEYCTGQYFPTEYRKAAKAVIEAALHSIRRNRTPQEKKVSTIAELKELNKTNGGCWFDRSSMRFFNSRIESGIIKGKYFISSEQMDDEHKRLYTVRTFDSKGDISDVGGFQEYDTKENAKNAINSL